MTEWKTLYESTDGSRHEHKGSQRRLTWISTRLKPGHRIGIQYDVRVKGSARKARLGK